MGHLRMVEPRSTFKLSHAACLHMARSPMNCLRLRVAERGGDPQDCNAFESASWTRANILVDTTSKVWGSVSSIEFRCESKVMTLIGIVSASNTSAAFSTKILRPHLHQAAAMRCSASTRP